MPRVEKTVFISYRRTNVPWALAIYQELMHHGYDVFFDYQSIDSGNFEKVILENIKSRAHFLVILTPSALERCKEPNDWLRREIETAMDEKRNIVPLMLESFDFGSPLVIQALTGKLATLKKYNGLRVYSEYFFEAMDKLRGRYLNVDLSDITLPTLMTEAREITETQKTAASEAPKVEKEELSAQEWFERAYVFQQEKNYDEAIRCYNEAIRLEPEVSVTYNNLGVLLSDSKRYVEAEDAYRQAIAKDPNYAAAYSNLGSLLSDKPECYSEAEDAYRQAIAKDPNYAAAYSNLGILLQKLERSAEAEDAYRQAIAKDPNFAAAYSNLGNLLSNKFERYAEAEEAYRQAIAKDPNNAAAYSNLGNLLSDKKLERYAEAEEAYRQAIAKDPNIAGTYLYLGLLLHENLKRYEEAEIAYRKAIELNPSNITAYDNLGILLATTNRTKEAVSLFEGLIKINPEFFGPYLGFASILRELEGVVPSEFIDRARELIPEDDFYNRACLESICSNFDLAFEYLKKGVQQGRSPSSWWIWEDPELKWIRDDPRFVEIVGKKPEK